MTYGVWRLVERYSICVQYLEWSLINIYTTIMDKGSARMQSPRSYYTDSMPIAIPFPIANLQTK